MKRITTLLLALIFVFGTIVQVQANTIESNTPWLIPDYIEELEDGRTLVVLGRIGNVADLPRYFTLGNYLVRIYNSRVLLSDPLLDQYGNRIFWDEQGHFLISIFDYEYFVFQEIQNLREERGFLPLIWCDAVHRAARVHSLSMLENRYVGHFSAFTGSPTDRVRAQVTDPRKRVDYVRENAASANITRWSSSREGTAAFLGWYNSPGHRDGMLYRSITGTISNPQQRDLYAAVGSTPRYMGGFYQLSTHATFKIAIFTFLNE